MDGFSYINIFDTKGIEYLIVIGFLVLFIPFWRALNKPVKARARYREAMGVLTPEVLRIPQGLHYCKSHMWTHLKKSLARLNLRTSKIPGRGSGKAT